MAEPICGINSIPHVLTGITHKILKEMILSAISSEVLTVVGGEQWLIYGFGRGNGPTLLGAMPIFKMSTHEEDKNICASDENVGGGGTTRIGAQGHATPGCLPGSAPA